MIPKKIHYCWFGGNPLSEEAKRYIDTWRNYCSDYEIIEWNENNFDVTENDYCREAYEAKKWAFVTDYVRLKVLYIHGGIYMDTDVEIVKTYNNLLNDRMFLCFEDDNHASIGTIGSEAGHPFLKAMLGLYMSRHFLINGSTDLTPNVIIATNLLATKYNLKLNGSFQILRDGISVYPMEYFIAKNYKTGDLQITEYTYAIHHYTASWLEVEKRLLRDEYQKVRNSLKLIPYGSKLAMLIAIFKIFGLVGVIKKIRENFFRE